MGGGYKGVRPMTVFEDFIENEYHVFKQRVGYDFRKLNASEARNFETWLTVKSVFRILKRIPGFAYLYRRAADAVLAEMTEQVNKIKEQQKADAEKAAAKPDLAVAEKPQIIVPGR